MDLHKITALPHSHLAKEKMSAARMGSYEGSSVQVGVQGQGEGPFAPSHCSALISQSGKKYQGGQQQYDETRRFARQARVKVGRSLDTFVLRIC